MQILTDIKFAELKRGDYSFIRMKFKDGTEDVGVLCFFDDEDIYPRYLTNNKMIGGMMYPKYIEEYGYTNTCDVRRTLYLHTENLIDTISSSVCLDSNLGYPVYVEILNEPQNIPIQIMKIFMTENSML